MKTEEEKNEIFKEYLSQSKVLIADHNTGARQRIATVLCELGSNMTLISMAKNYADAQVALSQNRPLIIISDYSLGDGYGLDMIQEQKGQHPEPSKCLFIIVTGNSSQSAVAKAAEEDIDCYILKPYTLKGLRASIKNAALMKLLPSDYTKLIEEGKTHLFNGEFETAQNRFEKAKTLNPEPTLACFYLAQVTTLKEMLEAATDSYKEGLGYNKIHYKCLVGFYELLMKQGKQKEAYEIVKRIAQFFPANPKRLSAVLRLAISTKNYEDIDGYYQLFIGIDQRTDELINYMCSALLISGKHQLRRMNVEKAVELFEKAAISSAGRIKFARFAIEYLVEQGYAKEAAPFLSRFPATSTNSDEYLIAEYLVHYHSKGLDAALQKGRELLNNGLKSAVVYRLLIQATVEAGYQDTAENLVNIAKSLWPEEADSFNIEARTRTH